MRTSPALPRAGENRQERSQTAASVFSLEGESNHGFDTNRAILDSVEDTPGSLVTLTVSADGEKEELRVPVLDGTLEAYRPYLSSGPASS